MPLRSLTVLLLVLSLLRPAQAVETPLSAVARLNDVLIQVMRDADALGFRGRQARLAPVLEETFDFPRMAAISVGRHWRGLAEAQRTHLVAAFAAVSIATFAARFDGYGGERWEVAGEEPAPRGAILVRNRLIKGDGEAIEINYLFSHDEAGWRAVDVILDAKYSELAIKRSEYGAVIKNHGFDELIRRLEDKAAELAAGG